jgi:hypothetical protein
VAAGLLTALAAGTAWLSGAAGLGPGLLMGLSQALGSIGQLAGPVVGFLALAVGARALLGLLAVLGLGAVAACRLPPLAGLPGAPPVRGPAGGHGSGAQ